MIKKKRDITEVIKASTPAVISIVVTKDMPKVDGFYKMPVQGKEMMVPKFNKSEKEEMKMGGGSGVIVSPDGLVLTNSHVLNDPEAEYTAFLDEEKKKKKKLKVIARDPIHDIAVCKIKGKNLPHIKFGDSSKLELGQQVITIGNALGEFSNTVSSGIVSGLSRYVTAQHNNANHQTEKLRGLIQTDAAINPGNSGGPLINMNGELIGINTAVVFGAQNIGFSIPVNQAKKDIEEVKKHGHVRIPFLGVRYIIIDEEMKKQNKLPTDHGCLIMRETLGDTAVVPGSCAEKAGLKEFDIILEADGQKITKDFTLQDILEKHEIGDKMKLKILRGEGEEELEVELEEKRK